jgi:hypothetical protein
MVIIIPTANAMLTNKERVTRTPKIGCTIPDVDAENMGTTGCHMKLNMAEMEKTVALARIIHWYERPIVEKGRRTMMSQHFGCFGRSVESPNESVSIVDKPVSVMYHVLDPNLKISCCPCVVALEVKLQSGAVNHAKKCVIYAEESQ